MKIKSLLLGSAAALMAVSSSSAVYAADAVIVEPEPVEYVRICDAYGAGFFYIPGTETCLRFSGYVRSDYAAQHKHEGRTQTKFTVDPINADLFTTDTVYSRQRHEWLYRARVNIDARNETEWGTLRSQIRLQADGGGDNSDSDPFSGTTEEPGDAAVGIDRALISLAGFRVGYSDDYWTTIGGYGYYKARFDGAYGYSQGLFLDYTYAADGFTATVGVSDNRRSGQAGQPDFYIGADYSGSWGRVFGTYHHDSNQSSGAWKIGAELNLSDYVPGGRVKGWYMSDDGDTDYVKGHAWGITAEMDLADNLVLFGGYSDYDCGTKTSITAGINTGCTNVAFNNSNTQWTAGVRWDVASGLYIQAEYAKTNYDHEVSGVAAAAQSKLAHIQAGNLSRLSTGTVNIRVVRSF